MADPQAYKVGIPGGGTGTIKGSEKLFTKHPEMLKRFISKSGNTLTIAKKAPGAWKVPAILAALGIGYIGSKIETWLDERTGKTGKIPEKLGTPTPKDTGPKALRAKPDPVKRAADRTQDYQKKARGGPIKKYAKGGGVRKAARY